ncbi:MAG: hypothetical protein O3B01_14630 [Planctomycetota bacterium]|nr:hypothetical protein [Planctomycetota bacterium]
MRYILSIVATLCLMTSGDAWAGCGKKFTDKGTLASADSETKSLVVEVKGEKVTLKLTPETKAIGKDGKEVKLADLVGKAVVVISEHKKVDSVTGS